MVEVLSAVVTACANETTECKSPNSLMVFSPTSLSEQCLELVVFVVHRKAISAPQTTASANLQFARKQDVDDSIVKNDQNAVVGVLLGDGIVIASGEATEAEEITRLQEVWASGLRIGCFVFISCCGFELIHNPTGESVFAHR